jgi:hypothetical protein
MIFVLDKVEIISDVIIKAATSLENPIFSQSNVNNEGNLF